MIALPLLIETPILLRVKVQADVRLQTSVAIQMDAVSKAGGPLGHATVRMVTAQRVKKIEPKQVTWSVFNPEVDVKAVGALEKVGPNFLRMKGFQFERVVDDRGATLKVMSQGVSVADSGGDIVLPEKPVSTGDTWKGDVSINNHRVHVIYRFDGAKILDNRPAYKITRTIAPNQPYRDVQPMEIFISAGDGLVLRSSGKLAVTLAEATITIEHKIQRLGK